MKKLLSIVLISSLALSSINLQAGSGTKKAWAYTKIGYGGLNLLFCMFSPIVMLGQIGSEQPENAVSTLGVVIFTSLPLGILSIKSGQRDLRRLKKKVLKKKAKKKQTLLA